MTRDAQDGPLADPPRRGGRSTRTLLLAAALTVIAFLPFAFVFFKPTIESAAPIEVTDFEIGSIDGDLRMVAPSFSGRTENNEPFTITADWALPDSPQPTRIELENLSATLTMQDGRVAALTARSGLYLPDEKFLELGEGVHAELSDGYTMETTLARIDVGRKRLVAPQAVHAEGPDGTIRADAMEALDAGGRIVKFTGNVRVSLTPQAGPGEAPAAAKE